MRKDQRNFLIDLQEELNTQTNDHNASPVFWVIRDYKWKTCNPDLHEADRIYVHDNEAVWGDEIENFMKQYVEEDESLTVSQISEGKAVIEGGDWYDMESWLLDNFEGTLTFIPEQSRVEISDDTMFITKESAQRHLDLNSHHYSDKAHTYAMTAWRSPVVEELWEVLRTADFRNIDVE